MPEEKLLERVRALLAKAENEGCPPAEAEALTAKAAELMAKYGIERAMIGALRPETDKPADRVFILGNPWGDVKRHLLAGIAVALRCQCVQVGSKKYGIFLHVFGYESDIERTEMLWTSLQVQMQRALAQERPQSYRDANNIRAWRRSFMLGFARAVVQRIKASEAAAAEKADERSETASGPSTALVLADRSLVVKSQVAREYPNLRKTRVTYSGSGYGSGHAAGQRADIGGGKVGAGQGRAIGR
jgi:hypothetical protein